ncbi:hypothetical protein COL8621_00872 [Actibacterium lipolyticum]|uniref:Uncharacterized protein n=1 Tax=Actibacterium lipolyticum TaxID=1524263 RepID=A0A238JSD9_9RHOB|nr:hypothetical protein COL8621_00872 [Actibacterium lipolyticum]
MILPALTRFGRKMAQLDASQQSRFESQDCCVSVNHGQAHCMRRGVRVRANRYPSPSLWSDSLRVRPDLFRRGVNRRSSADHRIVTISNLATMPGWPHSVASDNPNGGGAVCVNSKSLRHLCLSWPLQAVWTLMVNALWPVRLAVQSLLTHLAEVPRLALSSVVQQVCCATTQAFVTNQIASRALVPAKLKHEAIGAIGPGGFFHVQAGDFRPRLTDGRDGACLKRS